MSVESGETHDAGPTASGFYDSVGYPSSRVSAPRKAVASFGVGTDTGLPFLTAQPLAARRLRGSPHLLRARSEHKLVKP